MQKSTKSSPRKIATKVVEGIAVGRNQTVIPPEEVFRLAEIGCKDSEIAAWFGVAENTLRYNFSEELIKGRESLKISLRRAMLKNALTNENTTMQIWLSKQYLGMTDNPTATEADQPLPWQEVKPQAEQDLEDLENEDETASKRT